MNLCIIFVVFSLGADFLSCSHIESVLHEPKIDDSVMAGEVIRQFLGKYFKNDQIFISIISLPSKNWNKADFFINLPENQASSRFAYNILDKLDDTLRDNRHSFNLILVEDCKQLR